MHVYIYIYICLYVCMYIGTVQHAAVDAVEPAAKGSLKASKDSPRAGARVSNSGKRGVAGAAAGQSLMTSFFTPPPRRP